jgi:hypothetical protein
MICIKKVLNGVSGLFLCIINEVLIAAFGR